MQIVAVQLDMTWQDKRANHEKVRRMLSDAQIDKDALIILPEMFDTGFSMDTAETAQSENRESEAFLKQIASEYDSAVLGGVVSPPIFSADNGNQQCANEAVAFGTDGTELARYRKMQLFTPTGEHEHFAFGSEFQMFQWQGINVAPFVCYDLRFPEIFRPAAVAGAELIPVIASWPETRSEHWVRLLQARAIENQAFTVGVNRCGSDPTFSFDGRSAAFDPHGTALFEADAAEQVLTVQIDVNAAREWRNQFPALRDMRNC